MELETYIQLAQELGFVTQEETQEIRLQADTTGRLLSGLIRAVKSADAAPPRASPHAPRPSPQE